MAPSGPIVTVVGTASAVIFGGKAPNSGGRWFVLTASRSNRAMVLAWPLGVTLIRSLPAASAMRALPRRSIVRP